MSGFRSLVYRLGGLAVAAWLLTGCSDSPVGGSPVVADEQVIIEDVVTGTGPAVKLNDTLLVNYIGVLQATGEQFDSSFDSGTPFRLVFTANASVIEGWRRGLTGMQAGGRRKLTVPPSLGYGSRPTGSIPGNSTLVFTIDLVQLLPAP